MMHSIRPSRTFFVWATALLVFSAGALIAPAATAAPQTQTKNKALKIQDGIIVHVIFTEELSSEKNHPEDPVPCEIAEDVKVNGVVVIAKGTPAVGKVAQAEKRGGWGKSGTLAFSIDYVKAVDGNNVRLRGSSAQGGKEFSAGGAMMGLSGGFKKGKAIIMKKGSTMDVYVDGNHDVTVNVPES
ncbi:MAG TPA: hypothetical protein VKR82_00160 [Candidatus Acidoferrales bacterium]|nr:hypothetical protein [Candidatus Acidoferrales bacterium]